MSDTLPNDGLLKTARILTVLLMILFAIGFIVLAIAIPVLLLSQSHLADAMLPDATRSVGAVAGSIAGILIFGMGFTGLAYTFLRLLKRIINSVGEGDPFIAENADRLRRMGWIAIIIQLLTIPAGILAAFVASQIPEGTLDFDISFSFPGILIGLLLFILARIFRHGAEMRSDLEGTV
jgi:hypothetical protein